MVLIVPELSANRDIQIGSMCWTHLDGCRSLHRRKHCALGIVLGQANPTHVRHDLALRMHIY